MSKINLPGDWGAQNAAGDRLWPMLVHSLDAAVHAGCTESKVTSCFVAEARATYWTKTESFSDFISISPHSWMSKCSWNSKLSCVQYKERVPIQHDLKLNTAAAYFCSSKLDIVSGSCMERTVVQTLLERRRSKRLPSKTNKQINFQDFSQIL